MDVKEFLEGVPPGKRVAVTPIAGQRRTQYGDRYTLLLPELDLHCASAKCAGVRFFKSGTEVNLTPGKRALSFVHYVCRNCAANIRTFALEVGLSDDGTSGEMYKFGEVPSFGPPTPARLISLIGPDREMFLRGRRSENQGLGIAAFAYYRRVIENQKNRIIDEIVKVSEKLGASAEQLADLKAARAENQFSKAVDAIKHGVPQVLLINGHNPLLLLHSALSEGLHSQDDDQCLSIATSIRVVMAELADRLSQAMKDEAVLNDAVSRLLQKKGHAA